MTKCYPSIQKLFFKDYLITGNIQDVKVKKAKLKIFNWYNSKYVKKNIHICTEKKRNKTEMLTDVISGSWDYQYYFLLVFFALQGNTVCKSLYLLKISRMSITVF